MKGTDGKGGERGGKEKKEGGVKEDRERRERILEKG